jgi:hypothetical protein
LEEQERGKTQKAVKNIIFKMQFEQAKKGAFKQLK